MLLSLIVVVSVGSRAGEQTITKLMTIMPDGVTDPSPFVYDSTMYAMAGLMSAAFVAHYAVGPVNESYCE